MSEIDDKERLKRREALDNIHRKRELNDVAFILATPEGRRFYWRWMSRCGIFKSSFTGNNTTFFNEGERNIGIEMLSDMNTADPEAYLKCIKESKSEEAKNG